MARPVDLSRTPGNDPLTLLRIALEQMHATNLVIAQGVAQIANNTAKPHEHVYALFPYPEDKGSWLVYCLACSEAQGRYVHPCEVTALAPEVVHPPASIKVEQG